MTARWVDHFGTGIHSARPAANAMPKGALYACSTHGLVYQTDGSTTWSTWATLGTGGALDDSSIAPVAPNDQTASYTAVLADGSRLVRISNASAVNFTIPANASVAFPLGTVLSVAQQGAGQITVATGGTPTLRTPHGAKTSGQYAIVTATKVATDEWYVSGDSTT